MTLRELTDAAGVSVRTVRYYIAEGLLPPPEGSGPASAYTAAHLDRLRLIHQLQGGLSPAEGNPPTPVGSRRRRGASHCSTRIDTIGQP